MTSSINDSPVEARAPLYTFAPEETTLTPHRTTCK